MTFGRQMLSHVEKQQKDDITSLHSDILAMCCKVISSFLWYLLF